jgi:exodeoxyribonuclease VII large subunit
VAQAAMSRKRWRVRGFFFFDSINSMKIGDMPVLGVADFVALINQAFEMAFPEVVVVGELANFKVSKGKWVYFDLKDEGGEASMRCFGTVYMLPGPLEDGMLVEVRGAPKLHERFGFSFNISSIRPVGEGAIRKAAELLAAKLEAEGLFDAERKRALPYPPRRVGLVTSAESAAYADFVKILNDRWRGLAIELIDVQVQGDVAPGQIVSAVQWFNEQADPPDVLVLVRGGGSADDLAAYNTEQVVRAVAASRVPTLVAVGHEVDVSLAELAADQRASTPSNAAELLVPDRREVLKRLAELREDLADDVLTRLDDERNALRDITDDSGEMLARLLKGQRDDLMNVRRLAEALNPGLALARGFAIVRKDGFAVRGGLRPGDVVEITLSESVVTARVESEGN